VLHADRILYFIDDRQKLHMQQVFAISRRAGFVPEHTTLEHHPFGKMLGRRQAVQDPLGGTVKLAELLDEAVERAARLLAEREADLCAGERATVARQVGIGAVKYADLSKNRTSDYVFSWEHMLSFEGNTHPTAVRLHARAQHLPQGRHRCGSTRRPIGIEAPENAHSPCAWRSSARR